VAAHTGQETGQDRLGLLLARYGHFMNLRVRQALGQTGLGSRQGTTLLRLARLGPMSQQQLIETLGLDPSGLVAVLNDLERDGLVVRTRDPEDRRRHIVEITTVGRRTARAVESAVAEVEREAFADLDATEVAQLHDLLSRLRIQPGESSCAE
jgi:DNA-binding MarR family transcriptional regulator